MHSSNLPRINAGAIVPERAVGVSLGERLTTWWKRLWLKAPADQDLAATDEFATLSSLSLNPGHTKLKVGVVSVRGNHRKHNEDNYFVPGRLPIRAELSDSDPNVPSMTLESRNLFVVADGMGGQQAGEKASLMAVELIPRAVSKRLHQEEKEPRQVQDAIREAVAEVNSEIIGSAGLVTEYANMGTTVVLAQFCKDKVYVTGIGDSRAYRLRDGHLEKLTKDHTLADALFEAGTITEDELPHHKFKNVLYLYLGSKDARTGPEDFRVLDVKTGDRFIMASDGLTGVVSDDAIKEILAMVADPQEAAITLKDLALENDSKDNITCLVIHVVPENVPVGVGT